MAQAGSRAAIVLFTSDPESEAARKSLPARLFERLIEDWQRRTAHLAGVDLLVCSPERLGPGEHLPQRGRGFASLQRAADDAFERGYGRVLLVGNDAPALSGEHLAHTLRRLARPEARAQLTPDHRGGFAMLGLNRHASQLFDGLRWSGGDVAERLADGLAQAGFVVDRLPSVRAIDRADDLGRALVGRAHRLLDRAPVVRAPRSVRFRIERHLAAAHGLRAPPALPCCDL